MIRRLLNSVMETSLQPSEVAWNPHPFTKTETLPFAWLASVTPCFPVNTDNLTILTEPEQFYNLLVQNCRNARKRITFASLYLGNGKLESSIVDALRNNEHFISGKLKIDILLDYTRGSRYENNSRTMLLHLLKQNDTNCTVSLYHTPVLRGLWKKYTPNRWNELFGLQHMKLYICDDILIMTGANLSTDYFTNRQDRYFVIKDRRLSDFYCGLVNKVQKFSLKIDKENNVGLHRDWHQPPWEGRKNEFIEHASKLIESHFLENMEQNIYEQGHDTWIFPTIQMGQLKIDQDSQVTDRILADAPAGSVLKIATGYFNLTKRYMRTLIEESRATCDLLMAHPRANGFLDAEGVAGGIPYAYSLLARKFKKQYENSGQGYRIHLLEYLKEGWTYHAKGLWYYPPESDIPCLTVIGSPNFGERSVKKDLETQIVIITENQKLRKKLDEECNKLFKLGLPADTERYVPQWIRAFVFLFKSYF